MTRASNFKKCARIQQKRNEKHIEWAFNLIQGKINLDEIEECFAKHLDIESITILYNYILENSLRYRNRSVTIFAHINKIPKRIIAEILGTHRKTVRNYIDDLVKSRISINV